MLAVRYSAVANESLLNELSGCACDSARRYEPLLCKLSYLLVGPVTLVWRDWAREAVSRNAGLFLDLEFRVD